MCTTPKKGVNARAVQRKRAETSLTRDKRQPPFPKAERGRQVGRINLKLRNEAEGNENVKKLKRRHRPWRILVAAWALSFFALFFSVHMKNHENVSRWRWRRSERWSRNGKRHILEIYKCLSDLTNLCAHESAREFQEKRTEHANNMKQVVCVLCWEKSHD